MSLTTTELREKIALVEQNIKDMQSKGEGFRGITALSDYRDYLKDELRMLEDADRAGKSTKQ